VSDRVFPLLLVLTLLDLAFVQATGCVPFGELLPLWALAAAAPWLRNLQRHLWHRIAWNGGVLVVFMLLVQHATTTGLLHMLEDGLVLAVLCQVHLINNIGKQQRPDLIFFNSFLIAFVTSFFAPDVVWSLLFVVHAFALVPSLQVHALTRRRDDVPPALLRWSMRASFGRTLAIGAITAALFVALPRDFRREGWLGTALALREQAEAGLAERIRIDDERPTHLGEDVVAEFEPIAGAGAGAEIVPTHWRAIAFGAFDGGSWTPQDQAQLGNRHGSDAPWRPDGGGGFRRGDAATKATPSLRVRLHDASPRRLPLPLAATHVQLGRNPGVLLDPKPFGGFAVRRQGGGVEGPLSYEIALGDPPPTAPSRRVVAYFTALPPQGVPDIVHTLAAQLRREQPAEADTLALAHATAAWLERHRRYQLPGGPGFARNLGEFLLGSGAGHCEYFATALALLLRTQGVPCRLVGGYLTSEWDPQRRAVVARSKNAHAWVEVLDDAGRWHTIDGTPAADLAQALQPEQSTFGALRAELERWWAAVTGFGQADRTRWAEAIAAAGREHPFALGCTLAALFLLLYLARRRRHLPTTIAHLQRAIRGTGLHLHAGETPRELLVRAAAAAVAPDRLARLRAAAMAHESARYGAQPGNRTGERR
jgi:hypothetical protein